MSRTFRRFGTFSHLALTSIYIMRKLRRMELSYSDLHDFWNSRFHDCPARCLGLPDRAFYGKVHRDCGFRDGTRRFLKKQKVKRMRREGKMTMLDA